MTVTSDKIQSRVEVSEAPPAPPPPPRTSGASHHALASQIAGAVSTFAFYPLDVVKMRYMSQDGTKERLHNNSMYHSLLRSTKLIYREEGLGALYRGAHVAMGGAVAAWGTYMYLYRYLVHWSDSTQFHSRAIMSAIASASSALASNPIWVVKTRMQLEEVHRGEASSRTYRTFIGGIKHIVQTNGIRGLWRGASAQVLLGIPNSLNVPIYDTLKAFRLTQTSRSSLDLYEVCACQTMTRTLLMILSHPIFVAKTRLQDQRSQLGEVHYNSLGQALMTTAKREGMRGLYRGVVPALAQSIPRSVVQFSVYEMCLKYSSNSK